MKTMKYIVIASYIGRSEPMLYQDALRIVNNYRAAGINSHIEQFV